MCWTCTQTNANLHSVACTFFFFCTFARVDSFFYILSKEPCIPSKEPYVPSKEPCISSKEPSIPSFAHSLILILLFAHLLNLIVLSVFNIPQIAGMPQFGFASTVYRLFCKKIQCAQTRMLIFFLVAQGLHGGKQAYPKNAGDLWRANKRAPVKKSQTDSYVPRTHDAVSLELYISESELRMRKGASKGWTSGTRDFPSWRCLCTIQRMSQEVYSSESRTTDGRAGLAIFQVGDVCVQYNVWVRKYIALSHELRMDERDSRFSKLEMFVYNATCESRSI